MPSYRIICTLETLVWIHSTDEFEIVQAVRIHGNSTLTPQLTLKWWNRLLQAWYNAIPLEIVSGDDIVMAKQLAKAICTGSNPKACLVFNIDLHTTQYLHFAFANLSFELQAVGSANYKTICFEERPQKKSILRNSCSLKGPASEFCSAKSRHIQFERWQSQGSW